MDCLGYFFAEFVKGKYIVPIILGVLIGIIISIFRELTTLKGCLVTIISIITVIIVFGIFSSAIYNPKMQQKMTYSEREFQNSIYNLDP